MEEYILKDDEKERKKKQEYLIKNVIQIGLDPDLFANFLQNEKTDGAMIDNWTQEELETMVSLFKRTCQTTDREMEKEYKLEGIELDDQDGAIYVKRIASQPRPQTKISQSEIYVQISNQEIVDSGIFYGKSVFFHLEIHPNGLKIRRTESEFKWLYESMVKEFPTIPIPPLVKIIDKTYSPETLKLYKKFYEKFINDCLRHQELRKSMALDSFLSCLSKEELTIKQKEIANYFKSKITIEKSLPFKSLPTTGIEYLKSYPSNHGYNTLKISQILKQHFACAENQYNNYDAVFEKLEKINLEVEKAYKRLLSANQNLKEVFLELQKISIKSSSGKLIRPKSSLVEDSVFSSISKYFESSGLIKRSDFKFNEDSF